MRSQDTTMSGTTRDLACLGFSADLTMQSFCHTAAYQSLSMSSRTTPSRTLLRREVESTAEMESSTHGSTGCSFLMQSERAATLHPFPRWASHSRLDLASSPSRRRRASCPSTCQSPSSFFTGDMQPGITLAILSVQFRTSHPRRNSPWKSRAKEHFLPHPRN